MPRLTALANKTSAAAVITQHTLTYNAQDFRDSETLTAAAALPAPPAASRVSTYNAVNQLLTTTNPARTYTYYNNGNLMQGSTPDGSPFTAGYDPENQLKIVLSTDSSNVVQKTEYTYSGDGLVGEIKKYANSTLVSDTRLVYDGGLVLQDRDGNNAVVNEYTWGLNLGGGIGGLLNLKQGSANYAYLYDGSGNVSAVIDGTQAVVAAYRYDPFGKLLVKTGSLNQPFGFSTKRYDSQTGLAYFGYRFYAPELGRWITRDPLGEAGGLNRYAFVGNNPVNWGDPSGEEPISLTAAATIAGVTALTGATIAYLESPAGQKAVDQLVHAVVTFPSNVANVAGQVGDAAAYTATVAAGVANEVFSKFRGYEQEKAKLAKNCEIPDLLPGDWEPPVIGPKTKNACAAACLACTKGRLTPITCPFCLACLSIPHFTAPTPH